MPEAVLANSGGIDSRVAAAILRADGWRLHSVYHDWTQVGPVQGLAARATADAYCDSHEVVRWPNPEWVIWDENLRKWCLPHSTFHSAMLASMRAVSLGVQWVVTGARRESAEDSFRVHFQELLNASKFYPGKVLLLPLWDMAAQEVTFIGRAAGVDLDSTWSCPNADPHCGKCASCERRRKEGISL